MTQMELSLQVEAVKLPAELIKTLQDLHEKGYRYLAQDNDIDALCCFSLKPKKYNEIESWGYINPDAQGVLPAYPILKADIPNVKWSNRSATLIESYLEVTTGG